MMKIKKGDSVLIISGKDRGKQGKVLQVHKPRPTSVGRGEASRRARSAHRLIRKDNQVLVEAVNLKKKHQKPKKQGQKGQIILKPGSISISNVKIICRKCGKPVKVGYKLEEMSVPPFTCKGRGGILKKKYRICKKCGEEI